MDNSPQGVRQGIKYSLLVPNENPRDCIYEGISGESHCFTTRQSEEEWRYYFLAEKEFRANGSHIEVLIDKPSIVPISKNTEPMEFLQVQQAWNKVMGN